MKILALDLSTHAGYALMEGEQGLHPTLIKHGTIDLGGRKATDYGLYPYCYVLAAQTLVGRVVSELVSPPNLPDVIVVEETNPGRNRYSQKILEFIHYAFITSVGSISRTVQPQVVYLDTGTWRRTLNLRMNPEQKRANAKLSRAKNKAASSGLLLNKKALGIKGRVTLKHLAVNYVNEQYGLSLKLKDNNDADAICLGLAFCAGATPCNGV